MQSSQWMLQVRSAVGIQWREKLLSVTVKKDYREREKFIWAWGYDKMPIKLDSAIDWMFVFPQNVYVET